MKKKIPKLLFISFFVIAIGAAIMLWHGEENRSCLMYGVTYTPIKTVLIKNKKYHLYTSSSGMQDKLNIISMSPVELPATICDYSAIKTPIYSTEFDKNKIIDKLLIIQKADADFILEPIYSADKTMPPPQYLEDLPIETR